MTTALVVPETLSAPRSAARAGTIVARHWTTLAAEGRRAAPRALRIGVDAFVLVVDRNLTVARRARSLRVLVRTRRRLGAAAVRLCGSTSTRVTTRFSATASDRRHVLAVPAYRHATLAARFASFARVEFMCSAFRMRCFSALARNLFLLLSIHRRESAIAACACGGAARRIASALV